MSKVKTLLLATTSSVVIAGSAVAAEPPPPPYNWSGLYGGAHFGGGWSHNNWQETDKCIVHDSEGACLSKFTGLSPVIGAPVLLPGFQAGTTTGGGPLWGLQAGLNYQAPGSYLVWGIEGQYSWADFKDDQGNANFQTHITDVGTLALRVGWTGLDPRAMFFAKVGLGYVRENWWVTNPFSVGSGISLTGGMVGIGFEFALPGLPGNWSSKVEYDYLWLDRKDIFVPGNPGKVNFSRAFTIDQNVGILKIGLNYRFCDWPGKTLSCSGPR
jgi:outer membrane immunogenic protein